MARARNIKPGFFKNEDLAECSPFARLCFVGLWTLADREGRLEDRPKRIKGELFAFDSFDVEPLLLELDAHKFILRYDAGGLQAIQILKFAEHQTPHYTEKPSVIKPPSLQEFEPFKPPDSSGTPGNGASSRPPDSKNTPGNSHSLRGGRYPLNPGSGFLNPESLIPPPTGGGRAKRASRKCPPDFEVTQSMRDWAKTERPGIDVTVETAAFCDHEFRDAKTDWQAAWRNWLRKSVPAKTGRNGNHSGGYAAERNRAFGGEIGDNAHVIFEEEKTHDIALPHPRR